MTLAINFQQAKYIKSIGTSKDIPPSAGKEILFSGRSNAGKSSMINKLCYRKSLAKTSSTPGKTTTINLYSLGEEYYLADLPGYGYAKRSESEKRRWSELLEKYFSSSRNIALVIQLLDIRHNPTDDDLIMLDFLMRTNVPFIVALTKKDKLNKTDLQLHTQDFQRLLKPYRPIDVIAFSTFDPNSVTVLRNAIIDTFKETHD